MKNRILAGLLFLGGFAVWAPAQTSADPADLVKQARKLNNEGKQDEAIALYRQAIQANPNLAEAYLGAGVALDLQGQYSDARHHFEKAAEVASSPQLKSQAMRSIAMSYAFEHDCRGATTYEEKVFDSQMTAQNFNAAAETADELARICLESDDSNAAAKWYKTGHETALKNPKLTAAEKDLWEFRWENAEGRIAARKGQKASAQKHLAAAKAILDKGTNPDQARFLPYLAGYVAFYGGDYPEAITQLKQADQRDPFILSLLAQAYEKSGDREQAMELYRKILASNIHNPTNAFARPLAKKKLGA